MSVYLYVCESALACSQDKRFHTEAASVHRDKMKCIKWSWAAQHRALEGFVGGSVCTSSFSV